MQSPFSPYVHRRQPVKDFKRRQSQLPTDLIDWDAPEIPELEKQRIIYEEYIKECNEDHAIEMLITEEVYKIAHEMYVDVIQKQQRAQNNLLLGQHKLFEDRILALESTIKELESRVEDLDNSNKELEFRNQELEADLSCQFEAFALKKAEALDFKRKWEAAENKLSYFKKEKKGH